MGRAATPKDRENRRLEALELRLAGFQHRQIARKLGVATATAHNDVDLMLAELADAHQKRPSTSELCRPEDMKSCSQQCGRTPSLATFRQLIGAFLSWGASTK